MYNELMRDEKERTIIKQSGGLYQKGVDMGITEMTDDGKK